MTKLRLGNLLNLLIISLLLLLSGCLDQGRTSHEAQQEPPRPPTLGKKSLIKDFRMVNEGSGWATSKDGVFRTEDGGRTWVDVSPPGLSETFGLRSYFWDEKTGWVLVSLRAVNNSRGILFRTTDGGHSWEKIEVPFGEADLYFLPFNGKFKGWALRSLGVAMGSSPTDVFVTEDIGSTWNLIARGEGTGNAEPSSGGLPFAGIKRGISFRPDGLAGWVVTEERRPEVSGLYLSSDGGRHWSKHVLPIPETQRHHSLTISAPIFFGNEEAVMPVRFHGDNPGYIMVPRYSGWAN